MKAFVTTVVVLFVLDAIGKLYWLGSGEIPPRKPSDVAWSCFLTIAMAIWGAWTLWA